MKTSGRLNKQLFFGASALGIIFSTSAVAQSAVNSDEHEVVVTAQKRSQNIQDVPSTVSVVDSKLLATTHATQLIDFSAYVPGLQVSSTGTPGQATVAIRGIAPIGEGATVGTYIDDTPVGSSSIYASAKFFTLDLLPSDVSDIEVLSGPQGTLYGASTMGGLLKYVLTSPSLTSIHESAGTDVSAITGANRPGYGAHGMINAPIVNDTLGFYGSVGYENTPGYISDVQTGQHTENSFYQLGGRAALLWKPIPSLSIQLSALAEIVNSQGNSTVSLSPVTLKPIYGSLDYDNYATQPFKKAIGVYSATVKWNFGWADLTSSSSYSQTNIKQVIDYSRSYGPLFPIFGSELQETIPQGVAENHNSFIIEKYTQEVRISSHSGGMVDWLVGAFATYEGSKNPKVLTADSYAGTPIPVLNPLVNASLNAIYREYAGFGDVTVHLTKKFDISGGVRYSENVQDFEQFNGGLLLGNAPPVPTSSSEGVLTYSVSPEYHFTNDLMAYLRIASGYQPGGPNFALPGIPPVVKSDSLVNYELGFKSQFFDHKLRFDAAAYYIDWSDIQLQATNAGGFSYNTNGGTAKSEGVDVDTSLEPTRGLILSGSLSYDYAELTQPAPSIGGETGNSLPNIPRWSGSLRADYTHSLSEDWFAHLGSGLRLVGTRYSNVNSNPEAYKIASYGSLDLNFDLTHGRYTLGFYMKNVTDERAYTSYNPFKNVLTQNVVEIEATVLQPRTVGLRLDAKF